jgi:hypothetical protein
MKVLVAKDTPQRDEWLKVFGPDPVEVRVTGGGLKYRVDLAALKPEQRQRLISHMSQIRKVPLDKAETWIERRGVGIMAADVVIVNEAGLLLL